MRPALEDMSTMAIAAVVGAISGVVLIGLIPVALAVQPGAQFAWYAARAAGMLAYVLAATSVVFGIATSTKLGSRLLGKSNVADVHRSLSLLCLLAIGAHTLFLGLDHYANFTLSELFIPFVTWYRPIWTSLGIIAAYLAFAVYVSFYLRPVIGYRAWRSFHYLAFAVFGMGTVHGMLAGTDTHSSWVLGIYAVSTLAVVVMLAYRISVRKHSAAPIRVDSTLRRTAEVSPGS
jgi:sulfoxide reductase heme-binding subunit YedZ